jgi:hypothetical protein
MISNRSQKVENGQWTDMDIFVLNQPNFDPSSPLWSFCPLSI